MWSKAYVVVLRDGNDVGVRVFAEKSFRLLRDVLPSRFLSCSVFEGRRKGSGCTYADQRVVRPAELAVDAGVPWPEPLGVLREDVGWRAAAAAFRPAEEIVCHGTST